MFRELQSRRFLTTLMRFLSSFDGFGLFYGPDIKANLMMSFSDTRRCVHMHIKMVNVRLHRDIFLDRAIECVPLIHLLPNILRINQTAVHPCAAEKHP
jgi:hypothetical protein